MKWYISLSADRLISLANHNTAIFSPSQAVKNVISPRRQTKSPENSYMLLMFNNNTYTGFRTAQKHILNPSYAIQCDLTDQFHKTKN